MYSSYVGIAGSAAHKISQKKSYTVFNRANSSSSYVGVAGLIITNSQRRVFNGNVTLSLWKVASFPEYECSLFFY